MKTVQWSPVWHHCMNPLSHIVNWTIIDPSWFVQKIPFFSMKCIWKYRLQTLVKRCPGSSQKARFMWPTWGATGSCRPRWVPCWPRGPIRDHWLGSHSPHRDGTTSALLEAISFIHHNCSRAIHSVETSSTVDPQWNILHWGCKWNLHTVFWDAVGCEWGTTSVYFGITYVCFILNRLIVFTLEPQYQHRHFLFLSKLSFEGHTQNPQKIRVGLKFKRGL